MTLLRWHRNDRWKDRWLYSDDIVLTQRLPSSHALPARCRSMAQPTKADAHAFVRDFMGGPACLAYGASRGQTADARFPFAKAAMEEMLAKKQAPSETEMTFMMDAIQNEDPRLVILKIVDARPPKPSTLPVGIAILKEGVAASDFNNRG
jgi:hypothetical protein